MRVPLTITLAILSLIQEWIGLEPSLTAPQHDDAAAYCFKLLRGLTKPEARLQFASAEFSRRHVHN